MDFWYRLDGPVAPREGSMVLRYLGTDQKSRPDAPSKSPASFLIVVQTLAKAGLVRVSTTTIPD